MSKSEKKGFHYKTYSTKQGKMLAACDADILGESFREGETRLKISEKFYAGDKTNFSTIKRELQAARIVNLAGNKLISRLLAENYLEEEEVKRVAGVPHSQIFVM